MDVFRGNSLLLTIFLLGLSGCSAEKNPPVYYVGEVGQEVVKSVSIVNHFDSDFKVNELGSSCGCAIIENTESELVVESGSVVEVPITLRIGEGLKNFHILAKSEDGKILKGNGYTWGRPDGGFIVRPLMQFDSEGEVWMKSVGILFDQNAGANFIVKSVFPEELTVYLSEGRLREYEKKLGLQKVNINVSISKEVLGNGFCYAVIESGNGKQSKIRFFGQTTR